MLPIAFPRINTLLFSKHALLARRLLLAVIISMVFRSIILACETSATYMNELLSVMTSIFSLSWRNSLTGVALPSKTFETLKS